MTHTKRPPTMRPVYTVECTRCERAAVFHLVSHKFANDDTSGAYCHTIEQTFENLQEAITAMVLWNNVTNALPMRGDMQRVGYAMGRERGSGMTDIMIANALKDHPARVAWSVTTGMVATTSCP